MVQVTATPAGARDVRLFRNGTLVKVWRGDVLQGKPTARLETEIALVAGHNDLTAYAFNSDNVKSNDATLPLIAEPSLRRAGTTHVLAVGINAYANPQFDLRYAVADAEDFSAELQRQAAARSPGTRVEVTVLRNQQASKAAVLRAIAAVADKAQPERHGDDLLHRPRPGRGRALLPGAARPRLRRQPAATGCGRAEERAGAQRLGP